MLLLAVLVVQGEAGLERLFFVLDHAAHNSYVLRRFSPAACRAPLFHASSDVHLVGHIRRYLDYPEFVCAIYLLHFSVREEKLRRKCRRA